MFMPVIVDIKKAVVFGSDRPEGRQKTEKLSLFADELILVPTHSVDYSSLCIPSGKLQNCAENLVLPNERNIPVISKGWIGLSEQEIDDLISSATYVVSDLSDQSANRLIHRKCLDQGILCTVIDNKEFSNTYFASLIHKPPLTVSLSTSGSCAFYARKCREELELEFANRQLAAEVLTDLRAEIPGGKKRKDLLELIYADNQFKNALENQNRNKAVEIGRHIWKSKWEA